MIQANVQAGRPSCVTEIGCRNGMLLFRLAHLIGKARKDRYIGMDISTAALEYVQKLCNRSNLPYEV
eukprot:3083771-Heterocapsa_arctica.AAC.1